MANRDVSIAICGAVVGVILGAGSLSLQQDVMLHGSALGDNVFSYQTFTPRQLQQARSRNINQRVEAGELTTTPDEISKYPTVKNAETEADTGETASDEKPVTVCSAVNEALDEIAAAHDRLIPKNVKNTELLQNLDKVIAKLRAAAPCEEETTDAGTPAASEKKAPVINEACKQFRRGTNRYTQCVLGL